MKKGGRGGGEGRVSILDSLPQALDPRPSAVRCRKAQTAWQQPAILLVIIIINVYATPVAPFVVPVQPPPPPPGPNSAGIPQAVDFRLGARKSRGAIRTSG